MSFETVNRWLNNRKTIDFSNLERLYSYAYEKGIVFNGIYEQLYKEEYAISNKAVLFHGVKKPFSMPIDFVEYSKKRNDFGVGFYLGETFEQAAIFEASVNEAQCSSPIFIRRFMISSVAKSMDKNSICLPRRPRTMFLMRLSAHQRDQNRQILQHMSYI